VSAKTEQEDRRRRVHRLSTVFFCLLLRFPLSAASAIIDRSIDLQNFRFVFVRKSLPTRSSSSLSIARCIKRLRSGNTGSREAAGRADKKECRLSLQLCSWRVLIFHGESSRYAPVCATVSGHVNTLVRGSLLLFSQCFLSFSGVSFGFGWG
jgi:hypothetical protein